MTAVILPFKCKPYLFRGRTILINYDPEREKWLLQIKGLNFHGIADTMEEARQIGESWIKML